MSHTAVCEGVGRVHPSRSDSSSRPITSGLAEHGWREKPDLTSARRAAPHLAGVTAHGEPSATDTGGTARHRVPGGRVWRAFTSCITAVQI